MTIVGSISIRLILVGLLCAGSSTLRSQSTQQIPLNSQPSQLTWLANPKPLISSGPGVLVNGTQNSALTVRQARGAMFDHPFSQPLDKEPEPNAPETGTAEFVLHRPIDPLPDELSDVIVVGSVNSYQPYLSNDHGALYTEFYVLPGEILKDSTGSLKPGNALAVLQRGGGAKLSNGRVIRTMPASGGNPIDVNKTYLLFLSYHRDAKSYSVVKAWELVDNKPPIELDPDGKPKIKATAQYASLADLLNTLKARVASH